MAGKTTKGMSWGEVADYESCVDEIRRLAVEIAKDTRYYQNEAMSAVSDGQIYASNITPKINRMKANLTKITAYSKKYGRL